MTSRPCVLPRDYADSTHNGRFGALPSTCDSDLGNLRTPSRCTERFRQVSLRECISQSYRIELTSLLHSSLSRARHVSKLSCQNESSRAGYLAERFQGQDQSLKFRAPLVTHSPSYSYLILGLAYVGNTCTAFHGGTDRSCQASFVVTLARRKNTHLQSECPSVAAVTELPRRDLIQG